MDDSDDYVLWAGNLHRDATEELLFELFLQAGPLTYVKKPKDKNFAFIAYKHKESVKFAMKVFQGICLFKQMAHLKHREAKGTPRSTEGKSDRLDSGRREQKRRSRSRSPQRSRRDDKWGDDTPRRDTGRGKIYTGEDPYNNYRPTQGSGGNHTRWPGEDGYNQDGYNNFSNQSNSNSYKPTYTPDRNYGRQRYQPEKDHQRSFSAPQKRYGAGSNQRSGAYR